MLRMALLHCAINGKRCSVDGSRRTGHLPSFFVPTLGDLTDQESPSPGICHPRQKKNMLMPGGQRGAWGGGTLAMGAAGIDD